MLFIRNLNYFYGKKCILNNLSFKVVEGSFFVIIGPNGSGKSTLMRIIVGLEKTKNNNVKLFDLPIEKYDKKKLAKILAYVPQSMFINFPFSVYEFVSTGRFPYSNILGILNNNDKKIIMESMKFTNIDYISNCMVDRLSGGELQRVFIARAICQNPKIIVLDEPTTALDIGHKIKIMDLMLRLIREKGITVVMVSHDINLSLMYCDNIMLIKSGKIICNGNPNKVIKSHIIEKLYNCSVIVDKSPIKNVPRITPIPDSYL